MACSNLRHGKERKGRSVILEREIFNLQNKNPCGIPLYGGMRGSIRNLKAVEKIIHNCKPAKPPKKKNSIRNMLQTNFSHAIFFRDGV